MHVREKGPRRRSFVRPRSALRTNTGYTTPPHPINYTYVREKAVVRSPAPRTPHSVRPSVRLRVGSGTRHAPPGASTPRP
ncbi:hypothetical protein B0H17DRAFT_1045153 [Mycena rosella]|uniref:Uncharacterized protein n=1 Tax=Mycena rosella TaxID=1033263 RepID=A0AAD7DZL8_MYCRO|nr:hypothetical protein B0H17DRAFT_1045153 [Mycena rosella]